MKRHRHKAGAPLWCADSFFVALAAAKSMTGLPYRHPQGMPAITPTGEDAPGYATIYRRLQSVDVRRDGNVFTVAGRRTGPVALAVDSTGLKQHNRGEWIRRKWKVRRGFVKLHILADTDTKRILAIRVTDDTTGDSPMLVPILDEALGEQRRAWILRCPTPLRKASREAACTVMPLTPQGTT